MREAELQYLPNIVLYDEVVEHLGIRTLDIAQTGDGLFD